MEGAGSRREHGHARHGPEAREGSEATGAGLRPGARAKTPRPCGLPPGRGTEHAGAGSPIRWRTMEGGWPEVNGVAGVAAAARPSATRRRFTAEYKVRIVAEAGKCTERGAIGRLLEREGLSASRLSAWRKQARKGALRALGRKRGPKPRPAEEKRWREEVRRLQRENAGLRRRLLAADAVAERQVKRCGSAEDKAPAWEEVAKIVNDLAGEVGIAPACEALGVCRSTYYRRRARRSGSPRPRPAPPRKLSAAERKDVFDVLCSERFVDRSPAEVFATLLDEGVYLCSERTMYRVLAENRAVRERRPQRSHPRHPKPEVAARGPNQAWSWDITRLPGAAKGTFHYLYVVLDIYSRYVVGWMVADRESAALGERLIAETCAREGVLPDALTLHSDRGSPMTSAGVAQLLAVLAVVPSFSRPRVSNDNPYSESQFKTVKYHPGFPASFGSIDEARDHCRSFFRWYNHEHRHGGIALLTPEQVHTGQAPGVIARRNRVLATAYAARPDRFVNGPPANPELPPVVWINPPLPVTVVDTGSGGESSPQETLP